MTLSRLAIYSTATHSISTSVLSGSVLTATHLYVSISAFREVLSGEQTGLAQSRRAKSHHLRPARFNVTPVGHINLVHLRKVVHISEEDIDLDDFVNGRSRSL